MVRNHLSLAALATAAVAGLDVVSTSPLSTETSGQFDSALLNTRDGRQLIIRVPTSQEAEREQSSDLVALRALTTGARKRLPFRVPEFIGQAPIGGTRGIVYDYIPGRPASLNDLESQTPCSESFGAALAAIHSLPTSIVTEAGLPSLSAADLARAAHTVKERAAATGRVSSELLTRWSLALEDSALWQFQPTVVHGSLGPESFLLNGYDVAGILDWSQFSVGDPAADLYWLSSVSREESAHRVFEHYSSLRAGPVDHQLRKRARLYAELEIAKWLIHGSDLRDAGIVEDATSMLDTLSTTTQTDLVNPLSTDTGKVMAVEEVAAMLDKTPRSATAAPYSTVSGISEG